VRLRTESAEDTRALGGALARGLRAGDVVVLAGDLGSGKTTLAQGIGAGLGVADHVTSPTFTLMRSYPCLSPATPSVRCFLHADLYRLEHLGEVVDLGIGELVEDGAVAAVEWGDMAEPAFGRDVLSARLDRSGSDDERCVTVTVAPSWGKRRDEISALLSAWAAP
jgi:tRNA threonylcarbamoyladenosine biosynthesis protein TsaE